MAQSFFSVEVSCLIKIKKWILRMGNFVQAIASKGLHQEIQEEIAGMKKGILKRIGPAKGGYWEVIKK
jgi:hypothetical protein